MAQPAVQDEVLIASSENPEIKDEILTAGPPQGTSQPESPEARLRRTIRASVIASQVNEDPFMAQLGKLTSRDNPNTSGRSGRSLLLEQADQQREQETDAVRGFFIEQAVGGADPELIKTALEDVDAQDQALAEDEARGTIQYVGSMAHRELDPEVRKDLEVRLELLDQISDISDGVSGLEIFTDVLLEAVFTPKLMIDNGQLTGAFTDLLENENTVRQVFGWFQGLSPEKKLEWFPILRDLTLEALPPHRAVAFQAALLDPAAEASELNNFGFWPLLDAAAMAAGTVGLAFRLRKLLNPVKAAATAGDYERGADMNMALLQAKTDEVGELLDVPRLTAMNNSAPFSAKGVDDAADATLAPAVHERIFAFRDRIKDVFGNLAEGRTFAREGFLDAADRPAAVARIDAEYETYVRARFGGQDKLAEVRSTGRTEGARGVEFEFEYVNPDGTVVKDTYKGIFKQDEIGFWESLPKGSLFLSEKAQAAKTDFISLINTALRIDQTSANVAKQLRDLTKLAAAPIRKLKGKGVKGVLTRKDRIRQVDEVLLAGDDTVPAGKEFTPKELRDGVNGNKLDDDQIEYYYNMRGIMNGLGILRNMDTRAGMLARGVKELTLAGGAKQFGQVLDIQEAARRVAGSRGNINTVYKIDGADSASINVRDLDLEDLYARGFRLSRLEDDIHVQGAGRFQHVLIKGDKIGELPPVVVDLKKGYIPRINPDAVHFVQAFAPSTLDGVVNFTRKAVRSFDTKAGADAFKKTLDEAVEAGTETGFKPGTQFRTVRDGDLEAFRAGDSGLGGSHGLIHSPRAKERVPHNDGAPGDSPRTTALESIELYLENTKSFLTRNEWRMGAQLKWENTAKRMLPGNRDITFQNPGKALEIDELAVAHGKIQQFSGFMDKSERRFEGMVTDLHEFVVGKRGRGRLSNFIISKRQADPLATMRSLTFHTLLGMYNPIQLWVQAQGAAVAFSINLANPARLQRVFRQMHGMALIQHLPPGKIPDDMLRRIAKGSGFKDAKELQDMKTLWDKSGFYQSVQSSADVEASARGFPTTGGGLKRFADSGLMFFRTGELFNRRMGFLTAVDELGGAAKVAKSFQLTRQTMDRTNDIILNLGKANRAQWQKGLLSIPTQFLQIQSKTLETLLGINGAFTGLERSMLLTGQLALYGTAGVFGGNWVARNILSASGMNQLDIDEAGTAHVRALTGGFTDWFLYQMGANALGSDRGALLNGMDQTVLSLFTEEVTPFKAAFGPSSVLPSRLFEQMHQLSPWFATPQDINGQTEVNAQDVSDVLRRVATDAGKLLISPFSTASQYHKFRLMSELGILRDKNGNLIAAPRGGFNWQTEWATLAGFKPELLQRKFDISDIVQEERDYVRFRTTLLIKQFDEFLIAKETARNDGRLLTDKELLQHETDRLVLVDSMDPALRRKVMQSFNQRLRERRSGNSQLDRQQQRYWDNGVFDLTDDMFRDVRRRGIISDDSRIIQIQPELVDQEDE